MWRKAHPKGLIEVREYEDDDANIVDIYGVTPGIGDKIARDPYDHTRQWVIKGKVFGDHYKYIEA